MDWNRIERNWKHLKSKTILRWGKLTHDDLDVIDGQREQLAGKLQELYDLTKEEADKQINEFVASLLYDFEDEIQADYKSQTRYRRR